VENTTSLGLQLVEDLVAQLQGSVEIDDSAGTTVRIRFPAT
jgi:two-component sensor histidine kinase